MLGVYYHCTIPETLFSLSVRGEFFFSLRLAGALAVLVLVSGGKWKCLAGTRPRTRTRRSQVGAIHSAERRHGAILWYRECMCMHAGVDIYLHATPPTRILPHDDINAVACGPNSSPRVESPPIYGRCTQHCEEEMRDEKKTR